MSDYTDLVQRLRDMNGLGMQDMLDAANAIEALQERAERAEARVEYLERKPTPAEMEEWPESFSPIQLDASLRDIYERLAAIESRLAAPGHGPLTKAERERLFDQTEAVTAGQGDGQR